MNDSEAPGLERRKSTMKLSRQLTIANALQDTLISNPKVVLTLSLLNIAIAVSILVVLNLYDDDCNTPIRTWLLTFAIVSIIAVVLNIGFKISQYYMWISFLRCLKLLFVLYLGSQIVLFVMGNIWFYLSEDCSDDFEPGFILTIVLLSLMYAVVLYIVLGLFLCFCCIQMKEESQVIDESSP